MGGEFFLAVKPGISIDQDKWKDVLTKIVAKIDNGSDSISNIVECNPEKYAFEYVDPVACFSQVLGKNADGSLKLGHKDPSNPNRKSFRIAWTWSSTAIENHLGGRQRTDWSIVRFFCEQLCDCFPGNFALCVRNGFGGYNDDLEGIYYDGHGETYKQINWEYWPWTDKLCSEQVNNVEIVAIKPMGHNSFYVTRIKPTFELKQLNNCCAYCYTPEPIDGETKRFPKCGGCKTRRFCSRECQTNDWKDGHKHWCGASGQLGVDYEIRLTTDKGCGLFALRDFKRGEKVAVEKPILVFDHARFLQEKFLNKSTLFKDLSPSQKNAIESLAPTNATSLLQKVELNMMSQGDNGGSCLLINMSRVNHDCIGNSDHYFVKNHGLMLLIATNTISKDEEITFSYSNKCPHEMLKEKWGIDCHCDNVPKLLEMSKLDDQILELASMAKEDEAISCALKLLKYYEEFGYGPICFTRTYYDLFSLNVCKKRTLNDAVGWIKKAYDEECLLFSGCKDKKLQNLGSLLTYKRILEDPKTHHYYLRAERWT